MTKMPSKSATVDIEDLKERLKTAKEAIQSARDAQIQRKTEKESLQKQLDELIKQAKDEFDLSPDQLEEHAKNLEGESVQLLKEVESVVGIGDTSIDS